jgi:hypothetical protein
MEMSIKEIVSLFAIAVLLFTTSCGSGADATNSATAVAPTAAASPAEPPKGFQPQASRAMPNLQAEILDDRGKITSSPLGTFDFRNFTFPLPRGWQHQDGDEIVLTGGKLEPKFKDIHEEMSPEEKAAARAERRIGMSYVTAKYLDADNDSQDEAVVVLKVETGGNAVPQLVYIYAWKDGKPELLWNFRTGDRADGGLEGYQNRERRGCGRALRPGPLPARAGRDLQNNRRRRTAMLSNLFHTVILQMERQSFPDAAKTPNLRDRQSLGPASRKFRRYNERPGKVKEVFETGDSANRKDSLIRGF